MDLNHLLYNHQIALINEQQASCADERQAFFDLVEHYAMRIQQLRKHAGLPRYAWQ